MSTTLSTKILGVGLWSPVTPNWRSGREILSGPTKPGAELAAAALPAVEILPATERRRATTGTRLAIAAALEALADAGVDGANIQSVFASSASNPEIIHELCDAMATGDFAISPTRFHNSVHNSPSGYFSIGTGCRRASSSVGAGDYSAGIGLLEAIAKVLATGEPVLFVSFDYGYPYPLSAVRDIHGQWAVALVLAPGSAATGGAAGLRARLASESVPIAQFDCEPLAGAYVANPTGRLLAVLRVLALGDTATVSMPMPGSQHLLLTVTPSAGAPVADEAPVPAEILDARR